MVKTWNSKNIIFDMMMLRKKINNVEQSDNDDRVGYTVDLTTSTDFITETISKVILDEEILSYPIS